jgi:hypothetical protein
MVDEEAVDGSSKPACPHIKDDGDGKAHCELAEVGIKVFERLAKENEQKALDWEHEFNMYRSAWLRELGGELIPKTHDIDSFVLTTRKIRKEWEELHRPIPMILHCPKCHAQHVDAPETDEQYGRRVAAIERPLKRWTNPPHKSHLCHSCGCTWRPADVETYGVATIESRGTLDTWPVVVKEENDNEA